jgi:nitrite reductase/ring-hydroxylating ferredoxin subunit
VFIAGGIGITPFRSMLLDAAARGLPHRIMLIYSNRTPEGAPYHEELAGLARTYAAFRYVPTMVEPDKSAQPWNGERRFVNAEFLRDYVGDMTIPIFYLAGPPGLVVAATKTVLDAGAAPAHVLSEEFSGYESRPIAAAPAQTAVSAANFIKVAQQGELAPGQVKSVAVNGTQIALCNVDGGYYVIDDACTHRSALLSEGDLIGKEITCPLHGAIFDVTTGEVLEGPAGENLTSYRVRVSGEDIEVEA